MKQDLVGKKFNRLTVIIYSSKKSGHKRFLICSCSCGTKNKIVREDCLKSGHTKSCGCWNVESGRLSGLSNIKHGASISSFAKGGHQLDYRLWSNVKNRCYNKNYHRYKDYGGRGIRVYKKWKYDFNAFAEYIRSLPNCLPENILRSRNSISRSRLTIDRIDNDGDYRPGNLKWSDNKEQANNKRNNKKIKYNGETINLSEAVTKYAVVSYDYVQQRIKRGWSVKRALSTPVTKN